MRQLYCLDSKDFASFRSLHQLAMKYQDVLLVSPLNSALLLRIRSLFVCFLFPGLAEKTKGVIFLTADEVVNLERVFSRC